MERWEVIDAVQRMQNYIEEHLHTSITLNDLAKVAGYSPWHAARLFKDLTGKTPFDYLRVLRLSRAAILLRDGESKVLDEALEFVFDSHEGFTRAFTKQFGVSPKEYREHPRPIKLFMPYRIRDYYIRLQKGELKMTSDKKKTSTVFVQVVERPARKALIKRGVKATHYFEYCEEVNCDVWGILVSIKDALYEPAGMWLPDKLIKPGTSKYVQGVEVSSDYHGDVPEGFELIELEPCKLMVFQGEPFEDESFGTAIQELWDVIYKYDPTLYGFEWAVEDAPRFQLEPQGYRGYIEAIPVREGNK